MVEFRNGLVAGLEGISFVEQLSSRFEISTRTVVYGVLGVLAVILIAVCWVGIGQGGSFAAETIEPQVNSQLEQSPTEFDVVATAPAVDVPAPAATQTAVVYVTGAVVTPGLYTLAGDCRVGDAVEAAGGLAPEAASAVVNFAQQLQDGMQIEVFQQIES